jgi:hypothetical protein
LILAEDDCADAFGSFVVAEADVSIAEVCAEPEHLEELARALRDEILTLDVESVVPCPLARLRQECARWMRRLSEPSLLGIGCGAAGPSGPCV